MARLDAPVNEWGIPDWRKPEDYGDTGSWNNDRWRWEFTRRWADYRADFEAALLVFEPQYGNPPALAPTARTRAQRTVIPMEGPELKSAKVHYGMDYYFDPIVSDWTRADDSAWVGPRWQDTGFEMEPFVGYPDRPRLNTKYCRFDVSRPLKPQLEQAEAELREWHDILVKHGEANLNETKLHPLKWLTYLRALDARADRETYSEIATILPKDMADRSARGAANVVAQARRVFRFKLKGSSLNRT